MSIPKNIPQGFTRTWRAWALKGEQWVPGARVEVRETVQCQRQSTSFPNRLAEWTQRQYKASPKNLHFILKTIIETAFDIQGLRDTKLTHKSVLLKTKAKKSRGSLTTALTTTLAEVSICRVPGPRALSTYSVLLTSARGQALITSFYKRGTEAQTVRRNNYCRCWNVFTCVCIAFSIKGKTGRSTTISSRWQWHGTGAAQARQELKLGQTPPLKN